ncbi:zinc finger, CCHC-type containing protein [Tanacetum coccineum]
MVLTTNTPYPSRKIRRVRACTHQRPQRKEDQYAVSREDQYAILDIWHVNILEDIKRGPYSKKPRYACMTRSSTNKLFTPYKEPGRQFRSSRRHFKTLSLDELISPDFNLLSDQEYSEPKIEDNDNFELRGQFLKELSTNTFSGSDHEDENEHIEKVLEIVDLFYIPNITIDQVMLRAFHMSLTGAASRWLRNEPTGSITTWDGLKTKFLNKYCPPARTAKKMEEINNFQQEPNENLYQA